MNFNNRYNLWRTKRHLTPSVSFKAELHDKLMTRWAELNPAYQKSRLASHAFRLSMGVAAGVLAVSFIVTGAYAYTSPEVAEGSALYPIKKSMENIEEKVKFTPESKAKFVLKKVQRREAELDSMKRRFKRGEASSAEKMLRIEQSIDDLDEKLSDEEKKLENLKLKNPQIKEKIRERIERRQRKIENLLEKVQQVRK